MSVLAFASSTGGFPRHEAERLAREDVIAVLGPEPLS